MPFFRSFVETLMALQLDQLSRGHPERLRTVLADRDGVLDADAPEAGKVDAGLDRDHGAGGDDIVAVAAQ
jgi:hypothetical protein